MQLILWLTLILAAVLCVLGLGMILRTAREELKSRRREESVRKWVQSETGGDERGARTGTHSS